MPCLGRRGSPIRRLEGERRGLAERHVPLALSLARAFAEQFPGERAEFVSAACLGLVEAAGSYDPDRGLAFATWARGKIGWVLRTTRIEILSRRDRCVLASDLDFRLSALPERPGPASPSPPRADADDARDFERAIRGLPPIHKAVMRLIYLDGLTRSAAARALGLSPPRITAVHAQSLELLRS